MSHAESAQKAWEIENSILPIDSTLNALYSYPPADNQSALQSLHPWTKDPHFFKSVRISALALLKMVMHARSGGSLEVMGWMQGYVTSAGEFIVTDAFRLPVEGTETRVNASSEADEYTVNYLTQGRESGLRPENAVGWYHSHPGYGCWLSGVDVATQRIQQQMGPTVAVVIDPNRTVSAGKVEIGAFRTYNDDQSPFANMSSEDTSFAPIPQGKVEDFGKHASQYYSLEVSHFKSTLDSQLLSLLWNKYWAATLSQSPLITNHDYATSQIADLALKVQQAARNQKASSGGGGGSTKKTELEKDTATVGPGGGGIKVAKDPQLAQLVKTSATIAQEEMAGLLAEEVKRKLFWGVVEEARQGMAAEQEKREKGVGAEVEVTEQREEEREGEGEGEEMTV